MSEYTPASLKNKPDNSIIDRNYCQPNRHDEKMYRGTIYGYNFDYVNEKKQIAFTKPIADTLRSNHNSRENNKIYDVKLRE